MSWLLLYLDLASESIFLFLPIAAVIYGVFFLLRKRFNKLPHPGVFAAISFVVYLLSIASVPRYTFEHEVTASFENTASEFKLVNTAKWGAIVEPITLIITPIGFFHFVSPIALSETWDNFQRKKIRSYRSEIHRFSEKPIRKWVNVNCSENLIYSGAFKQFSPDEKMSDHEKRIYCETDYSEQIKIFQCKYNFLNKRFDVSDDENIEANNRCK